jgi:hypothetical protein
MEAPMVSPSLSGRMRASLAGEWRQARPAQRLAYLVGATLILVGLGHLTAWLVLGGAWQGPVSFRKPTTFGISFGLTTITLAWVTGQLQVTDRSRWLLLGPLAVADTVEVVWVATQRWREVASHFNFATTLDYALFLTGAAAITVTVTVIVALTVLAFTRLRAAPSMAVAVRAGLLILLMAQGVGGWMIGHGVGPASDGVTQGLTTVGAAGVMKVPHAVAMHAIQVLPGLAWLLGFAAVGERRRLGLVWAATTGYGALVAVSLGQTAAGLAPLDVGVAAAVLSLLGVLLLGVAFGAALLALRRPIPAATSSSWPASSRTSTARGTGDGDDRP